MTVTSVLVFMIQTNLAKRKQVKMAEQQEKLVEVENLVTYFPIFSGILQKKTGEVKAVDDISFFIRKGETLGLVG